MEKVLTEELSEQAQLCLRLFSRFQLSASFWFQNEVELRSLLCLKIE